MQVEAKGQVYCLGIDLGICRDITDQAGACPGVGIIALVPVDATRLSFSQSFSHLVVGTRAKGWGK